MSEIKSFLVTIVKWHISGEGYKRLIRFSKFVLFKTAASTMQKITSSAASIFVSEGLFIYIYFLLLEENQQNRISRAGEKISQTISLFFLSFLVLKLNCAIEHLYDIIPRAQSWLVSNLPVFMFISCLFTFNVPLSDEKIY